MRTFGAPILEIWDTHSERGGGSMDLGEFSIDSLDLWVDLDAILWRFKVLKI
jgi:hypothetical protein